MTVKLEVGKTYIDERGIKVEIIRILDTGFGGNKPFKFLGIGKSEYEFAEQYNEDGESATSDCDRLVKEYREPVEAEGYIDIENLKALRVASPLSYRASVDSSKPRNYDRKFVKVKITEIQE